MKKVLVMVVTVVFMFVGCTSSQPVAQNPNINAPTKRLYKNEKAMYQKFQAKKAGDELEKELNK